MPEESEAARDLRQASEAQNKAFAGPTKRDRLVIAGVGVAVAATMVGGALISNGLRKEPRQHERPTPGRQPLRGAETAKPVLQEVPQSPASTYAERVKTYWLPEARSLPNIPPEDDQAFGKLLTQIDGLVIDIEDGTVLPLNKEQKAARSQLINTLSKKQQTLLPALRKRYAQALDAKLFRDDIRVSVRGSELRFVGAAFVRNANIEDMQTSMLPVVNRLRFRRVEYRWSPHFEEGVHYDLAPPGDAVVARWDGTQFVKTVK